MGSLFVKVNTPDFRTNDRRGRACCEHCSLASDYNPLLNNIANATGAEGNTNASNSRNVGALPRSTSIPSDSIALRSSPVQNPSVPPNYIDRELSAIDALDNIEPHQDHQEQDEDELRVGSAETDTILAARAQKIRRNLAERCVTPRGCAEIVARIV